MKRRPSTKPTRLSRRCIAVLCAALLVPAGTLPHARSARAAPDDDAAQDAAKIPDDQLDSLVAPIALYPDPLLGQVLVASTYPLEIIQLQQWLERNKNLKDKALADAVAKQPWDPSIQAMAGLPDVVKRLADDVQWTTDLGNAFLAQQDDVMRAVQRMRRKAQDKGTLKSSKEMKVETKVVESQQVIVIEQASPQVVYVPSYDPVVVYGAPAYPYPPIYYPPAGYYAAGMALSFGVGVAMGAMWSGGWGYGCGWGSGHNDVTINNNNNFNRNNINNGNRGNINNGKWQHNPQHRGGAPYRDRATANRYGGNARGDSLASRQAGARQQVGRQQGAPGGRGEGVGGGARGGAGTRDMGGGRGGAPSARDVGGSRGGGAERVGSRDMSRGYGGGDRGGGLGGGGGYSGSNARASSNRGSSSFGGSRGGGGGFGGGGSRGGGGRGGGGGRRR